MKCMFSVVTPSYNGASTLPRVYDSLCRQTLSDFEWIVVDDGSTDNTRMVIDYYKKIAPFNVIYLWQENSHKKVAVNRGVEAAKGDFVAIIDDDDEIAATALETFAYYWKSIPEDMRGEISGVTGLCIDENGRLVGDTFPSSGLLSTDLEIRLVYGVEGEKWGVKRTDVMREFPYPEDIPGYVPESLVWSRIDRKYKTLYINEIVRIYYMSRQREKMKNRGQEAIKHCAGRLLAAKEALQNDFSLYLRSPKNLFKLVINYGRYSLHSGHGFWRTVLAVDGIWKKILVMSGFIGSLVVYWLDRNGKPLANR